MVRQFEETRRAHLLVILDLDEAGIAELARTGVRSSFLDPAGKRELLEEIDTYVASRRPRQDSNLRPSD